MLKKTVTYTNYDGVEITEDLFFNLSKAELIEMELGTTGGYSAMAKTLYDTKQTSELIKLFKTLLLKSYGVKTADGIRFRKTDDNGMPLSVGFSETEAYSQLFTEFATNADAAAEFFIGIMPPEFAKNVDTKKIMDEMNGAPNILMSAT